MLHSKLIGVVSPEGETKHNHRLQCSTEKGYEKHSGVSDELAILTALHLTVKGTNLSILFMTHWR